MEIFQRSLKGEAALAGGLNLSPSILLSKQSNPFKMQFAMSRVLFLSSLIGKLINRENAVFFVVFYREEKKIKKGSP